MALNPNILFLTLALFYFILFFPIYSLVPGGDLNIILEQFTSQMTNMTESFTQLMENFQSMVNQQVGC